MQDSDTDSFGFLEGDVADLDQQGDPPRYDQPNAAAAAARAPNGNDVAAMGRASLQPPSLRSSSNAFSPLMRQASLVRDRESQTSIKVFRFPVDPARGLGIQVKGGVGRPNAGDSEGTPLGLFVQELIAGGSAALDGRLAKNDRLLEINGVPLATMSNEQAMQMLRNASMRSFIELTISRSSPAADPSRPPAASPSSAATPAPASAGASAASAASAAATTAGAAGAAAAPPPPMTTPWPEPLLPQTPRTDGRDTRDSSSHASTPSSGRRRLPKVPSGGRNPQAREGDRGSDISGRSSPYLASTGQRVTSPGTVQEIELPITPSGLDINIYMGGERGPVRVKSVHPSGNAGTDGRLRPGDVLLAIDGKSLENLPLPEVLDLLALARGPRQELETVYSLPRTSENLGISLTGGLGSGQGDQVRIKEIRPGSAAARDGQLQPGMVLLSVDDHSLVGVTHNRAITLLSIAKLRRRGRPTITFRVRTGVVTVRFLSCGEADQPLLPPPRPADTASAATPPHSATLTPASSEAALTTVGLGIDQQNDGGGARRKFRLADLQRALRMHGHPVDAETQLRIAALLHPDADGAVPFRAYMDAAATVLGVPSAASIYTTDSFLSLHDAAPAATRKPASSIKSSNEALNRVQLERDTIEQELMHERAKRAQAEMRSQLATAARLSARGNEKDYEEIVALLEAEVAHLKAQLIASPDEKDKQLMHFRQRTVVLGVQLNKAVKVKRNYELVVQRLLEFTRGTLGLLRDAEQKPRVADKRLTQTPDGRLRFRPSEQALPPSAAWSVGDVCRAPRGPSGELRLGMVHAINEHDRGLGQPETCVVRFTEPDNVLPVIEVKLLSELRPLEDEHFVVQAVREGSMRHRLARDSNDGEAVFLSPLEHTIAKQAGEMLNEAHRLLQDDESVLPFGWEEAYTIEGEKYFIDHTTQTTSWVHPNSRVLALASTVERARFGVESSM